MLLQFLQPDGHVVDDPGVVGGGLVVHGPSAPDELQAPLRHQVPDQVLHLITLLVPPAPEEGCLHLNEPSNAQQIIWTLSPAFSSDRLSSLTND